MWMAGNVATLPMFSLVPGLLAKNVCLVKLALPDPAGIDRLLAVLADSQADGLRGRDLLEAVAVVWFDYRKRELNEEMSLAADARDRSGAAHEAIRAIPRCRAASIAVEIVFGPKYSIGVIDRKRLGGRRRAVGSGRRRLRARRGGLRPAGLLGAANDLSSSATPAVRWSASAKCSPGNSKSCRRNPAWTPTPRCGSSPSAPNGQWTRRATSSPRRTGRIGPSASTAKSRSRRPCNRGPSSSPRWTRWHDIVPLLSAEGADRRHRFRRASRAVAFAEAATAAGVVRCVRPGLMNQYESPWDGKLLLNELVRWVILKP